MSQSVYTSLRTQMVAQSLLKEGVYAANVELPTHPHERANWCLVLNGTCTEMLGRELVAFKPLTLGFLVPGNEHSLRTDNAQLRCFGIELAPALLERASEYSLKIDDSVYVHGGELVKLFTKIYHEFCVADAASPLAIEGLMMEALAEVARKQTLVQERRPPLWLKQAEELLHAQFSDPPQLSIVAAVVNVHPVHLAREFRRHFKCTVGEYVRGLRVDYARRELTDSNAPLAMIAQAAGYTDQSHLTREFKRLVGVTPRQYRNLLKLR